MPTGMGAASPKFSKSNRKPKKIKHCTIPNLIKIKAKELKNKESALIKYIWRLKFHEKNSER